MRVSRLPALVVILSELATACGGGVTAGAPAIGASPSLPANRMGVQEVALNGVQHWFRVSGHCFGRTPPVVFLHGGPGEGSDRFAKLIGPSLETEACMVYFDQRGSGRSSLAASGDYTIQTLVSDIEALRQHLGVPKLALVGHSFGVLLALEYAAAHPEHAARLVLAGGVSDVPAAGRAQCARLAETDPSMYERAVAAAVPGSGTPCNIFALPGREVEAFFTANMFPHKTTLARLDTVDRASGYRHKGEMQRALFQGGLLTYRFSQHGRLTMPVLVIAGLHDHQGGREPHRTLVRNLPNARLLEYENSGHFMYVDEPERFARDVLAFLGGG